MANYVMGMLFPLITFPYVSRVLMPEGIGEVQFLLSVINYVAMVTAVGLPMYAVREVSRCADEASRRRVAAEIGLLSIAMCVAGYAVVFILVGTVERLAAAAPLFLALSVRLLFTLTGAEWYFQATEQFRYMTIRSLVIRVLSAVAMFVFIRDADDVMAYAVIIVCVDSGYGLLNWSRMLPVIRTARRRLRTLRPWRHLVPALRIFSLGMLIAVYTNLDSAMLGFMSSAVEVGFYAAALRVTRVVRGLITAIGAALLPRLTALHRSGACGDFASLSQSSLDLILALVMPASVAIALVSEPLIAIFCGDTFAPAARVLTVMSPLLIFTALSDIAGLQILYAQGREAVVIKATALGAIVDVALNLWLIPRYGAVGAAISTFAAEGAVFVAVFAIGRRYIPATLLSRSNAKTIAATVVMAAAVIAMLRALGAADAMTTAIVTMTAAPVIYYGALLAMGNAPARTTVAYLARVARMVVARKPHDAA